MLKGIIFISLPTILIIMLSTFGYAIRNYERFAEGKACNRTDSMLFGHYWILFSVINLFFLSRLFGEDKWEISYIPPTYVTYLLTISVCIFTILWFFSIFYLKVLAKKKIRQRRRHIINLFGAFALFTLSWALSWV